MAHDPAGQIATIAATNESHPPWIKEVVPLQRLVEHGQHVRRVGLARAANDGPRKGVLPAAAAPRIAEEDGIAGAGLHLELVEEGPAILDERPTVDVD